MTWRFIRHSSLVTASGPGSTHHYTLFASVHGAVCTGTLCELCLSLSHPTRDCTLVNDQDPDITTWLMTLESALLVMTSHLTLQQGSSSIPKLPDICQNWNDGKCCIPHCWYRPVCRVCGGPIPVYACYDHMLGPSPNATHPMEGQHTTGMSWPGLAPSHLHGHSQYLLCRTGIPGRTLRPCPTWCSPLLMMHVAIKPHNPMTMMCCSFWHVLFIVMITSMLCCCYMPFPK